MARDQEEKYGLNDMVTKVSDHINKILRENLYEMNLDKERLKRLLKQKKELRENLMRGGMGDDLAKRYIIEFLKECLLKMYSFTENSISETFYFSRRADENVEYIFDRLLYIYKGVYGKGAMRTMINELYELHEEKRLSLSIDEGDIRELYGIRKRELTFTEKMDLLAWKVYSAYKGLGIVDELRDMHIDGVSGGVSGAAADKKSVWIFFMGRSIHLSFLEFESDKELERVCRNVCRFEQPGEISRQRGYIVHEMADHSRVVVARPDFAESWMFFIRKLDQGEKRALVDILPKTKDAGIPVLLLMFLMKGCQVVGITGMQGCGKTTLLMALVEHIPQEYTIRVLELAFELHLRELYPKRNVVTFRETGSVGGFEGLEVQKKTDGAVSIIGEVASSRVAAWMVESGQTGSLFTLFTHHARNTRALIASLRNSLLKEGSFSNERIATEQVVSVVHFDVHLHLDRAGKRYIERITQITEDESVVGGYHLTDLVVYEDGIYVQKNRLDEGIRRDMRKWMNEEERRLFDACDI